MQRVSKVWLMLAVLIWWSCAALAAIPREHQNHPKPIGGIHSTGTLESSGVDYRLLFLGSTLWSPTGAVDTYGDYILTGGAAGFTVTLPPEKSGSDLVATVSVNGRVEGIRVFTHFAVVQTQLSLWVFDLTDISSPQLIDSATSLGGNQGLVSLRMRDSTIYAAHGTGIMIFHLGKNGRLRAAADWNGYNDWIRGIDLIDTLLLVRHGEQLSVLSTTVSQWPAEISSLSLPFVEAQSAVKGSMVYFGPSNWKTLYEVDLCDPTLPHIERTISLDHAPAALATSDSLLLVASSGYGITILNLNDSIPVNPVGVLQKPYDFLSLLAMPGFAIVVTAEGSFLMPLTDPSLPAQLYSWGSHGWHEGVRVMDTLGYVVDGYYGGLHIVNLADISAPKVVGYVDLPDGCLRVDVLGNYAFVASSDVGLISVDVTNPEHPVVIDTFSLLGGAYDVAVSGGFAYLPQRWYFTVVNISNPRDLHLWGLYYDTTLYYGVTVRDTLAYVASGSKGLTILDVADPFHMRCLSRLTLGGEAGEVRLQGDYAYVAAIGSGTSGGLIVVNVADPLSPRFVKKVLNGDLVSVGASGKYVCYADGNFYFGVADIADPENPVQVIFNWDSINIRGIWPIDSAFAFVYVDLLNTVSIDDFNCDARNGNRPPVITSPVVDTAVKGHNFVYEADAIDPDCDGRGLTYSFPNYTGPGHPSGRRISVNLSCQQQDFGFKLVVSDDVLADTEQVLVRVLPPTPPQFAIPTDTTLRFGESWRYVLQPVPGSDSAWYIFWNTYPAWCQLQGDTLTGIAPSSEQIDVVSLDALSQCAYGNTEFSVVVYRCGDADGDREVDIADAVLLVQYIFGQGSAPAIKDAGDADCDGSINIADVVYLVNHVFCGGPDPCNACR